MVVKVGVLNTFQMGQWPSRGVKLRTRYKEYLKNGMQKSNQTNVTILLR